MDEARNLPIRQIAIGALIGGLLGAVIAWAYASGAQDPDTPSKQLEPLDFMRLGVLFFTSARQIGEMIRRA